MVYVLAGTMPNMRRRKYDPCNKGEIEYG